MKKYTKIIVDIPRGELENNGDKDGFHTFHLGGKPDYDYSNWTLSELKELAKKILIFVKEVETSDIVPPIKHIK